MRRANRSRPRCSASPAEPVVPHQGAHGWAAVSVLGDFVSRLPLVRPSGTHTAMGGFVLDSALRGIAAEPSRSIPAAGVVIASAFLLRALRSAEKTSAHDARILAHDAHARYGHHPATPVAGG